MEQLPKLVRDRLGASRVSEHPDADLLTGFSEHSLSDRERDQVAGHLAECRECRDVVALAAPELLTAAPGTHGIGARQPWLRLPVLRWGALAASVIIVGAAVLIGTRTQQKVASIDTFSSVSEQPRSQPVTAAQDRAEIQQPKRPENQAQRSPVRTKQLRDKLAEPGPRQMSRVVGGMVAGRSAGAVGVGSGGGVGGGVFKAQLTPTDNRPSPEQMQKFAYKAVPPPGLDQAAEAKAKPTLIIPPAVPPTPAQAGANQLERGPSNSGTVISTESMAIQAASPTSPPSSLARTAKSTQKEEAKSESVPAAYGNRAVTDTAASAPAALMPDLKMPKWTLSEDGLPQRSFDSGKSWEKIPVDSKTGFRALAATGTDVWVGGRAGLLYHSTDIGLHWTRVTPVANGATFSADIVRIEFPDAVHGKITASDGSTWVTSDQGKNWIRQ